MRACENATKDQAYKSGVILKLTQRGKGPDGHVDGVQRRMDRVSANPRRGWLESIRGNRGPPSAPENHRRYEVQARKSGHQVGVSGNDRNN
jgi:hypothetical protein